MPTTIKTDIIAMKPGIAGYPSFQKGGRHGSVRDSKAVGRRCTKAVAIRTPVPKCRDTNKNWWGTGIEGKRLTTMGKEQAAIVRSASHSEGAPSGMYTCSTQ
jgi:hypothetical protein